MNKFLDSVRRLVFLQDTVLLVKVVVGLLFISSIGTYFSTPAVLLIGKKLFYFNFIVVLDVLSLVKFTEGNTQIVELKNTGVKLAQKYVFDRIPRYQEKEKKE